jgi:hypothetical protein
MLTLSILIVIVLALRDHQDLRVLQDLQVPIEDYDKHHDSYYLISIFGY